MKKSIHPSQPKHRQVFEELRHEIASGKYSAGQKLPSEAALVNRFATSRITVGRAVRDLSLLGLVDRRAGSGTYVRAPRPGSVAGGLSFGLLISDLDRTDVFEPMCQGMAEAPQASEHVLLWGNATAREASVSQEDQMWKLCQQYISRQVSGVFFTPLDYSLSGAGGPGERTNQRIVAALKEAGIPLVLLDRDVLRYPGRSEHDLVGIDNWRAGVAATNHLLDLGCHQPVFLTSSRSSASSVEERIAGYREALIAHNLAFEPRLVQRLDPDSQEDVRQVMETIRPDGFVCANDRTAGRLMHSLMAMDVSIPKDVRVVGFDDTPYASLFPVPLTTMHQPCREIGMAAMETMLQRLSRPEMPARHVLLNCPLVVRKSCGDRSSES